jgi:hypothetical protein
MTMTCRTCRSENRDAVDIALVNGEPLRNIAKQSDLSLASVYRHRESHLPAVVANAKQAQELTRADVLVSVAAGLLDKALGLLEQAEAVDDRRGAVAAMREARSTIELLSKLRPDERFDDSLTPNPLQWAQWVEIAATEFTGRPRLANQFAHDLATAFFGIVGDYVPQLGPGARERFLGKIDALDREYS